MLTWLPRPWATGQPDVKCQRSHSLAWSAHLRRQCLLARWPQWPLVPQPRPLSLLFRCQSFRQSQKWPLVAFMGLYLISRICGGTPQGYPKSSAFNMCHSKRYPKGVPHSKRMPQKFQCFTHANNLGKSCLIQRGTPRGYPKNFIFTHTGNLDESYVIQRDTPKGHPPKKGYPKNFSIPHGGPKVYPKISFFIHASNPGKSYVILKAVINCQSTIGIPLFGVPFEWHMTHQDYRCDRICEGTLRGYPKNSAFSMYC